MCHHRIVTGRHRSRQRALQVLYQWDVAKQPLDQAIATIYEGLNSEEGEPGAKAPKHDAFMEELARGTSSMAPEIDRRISDKTAHWRLDRMPAVDRNILRLAVYEMTSQETPAAVIIDEAIELARQFSGDESASFINGVLDAVHKELRN